MEAEFGQETVKDLLNVSLQGKAPGGLTYELVDVASPKTILAKFPDLEESPGQYVKCSSRCGKVEQSLEKSMEKLSNADSNRENHQKGIVDRRAAHHLHIGFVKFRKSKREEADRASMEVRANKDMEEKERRKEDEIVRRRNKSLSDRERQALEAARTRRENEGNLTNA